MQNNQLKVTVSTITQQLQEKKELKRCEKCEKWSSRIRQKIELVEIKSIQKFNVIANSVKLFLKRCERISTKIQKIYFTFITKADEFPFKIL